MSDESQYDAVFIGENNKELIEVYTSNGEATGVPKHRKLIHELGDFHHTVQCWVINKNGQMILQQRSPFKKFYPSAWDVSTAGHISFGESSREACVKELFEELGISAKQEDLELIFEKIKICHSLHNNTYIDNEFVDVYLLYLPDLNDTGALTLQASEVSRADLFHFEVIEKWLKDKHPKLVPVSVASYYHLFDHLRSMNRFVPTLLSKEQVESQASYHGDKL